MSLDAVVLQQLGSVFSPWDSSPPSSDVMGSSDNKHSSNGDVSSSPEEGFWDDLLACKLAEKLIETKKEPLDYLDKYLENERLDNERLDNVQPPHDTGNRVIAWNTVSEDYIDQTYRSVNPRFKTEICRNFKEKGTCLYGDLCQFAHGNHELRKDVVRHTKYKTKLCQKYWIAGYCAYGPRCNFIHQEIERDQAMRILASGFNETRNSVPMYKSATNVSPVVGYGKPGFRKEGVYDTTGDFDMERSFSKLGLGGLSDRISPMSRSSPVDFDMDVANLLPRNFGVMEEQSKDKDFFRRPIGCERYGEKVAVWNDIWTST